MTQQVSKLYEPGQLGVHKEGGLGEGVEPARILFRPTLDCPGDLYPGLKGALVLALVCNENPIVREALFALGTKNLIEGVKKLAIGRLGGRLRMVSVHRHREALDPRLNAGLSLPVLPRIQLFQEIVVQALSLLSWDATPPASTGSHRASMQLKTFRGLPAKEFVHGPIDLGRKGPYRVLMDGHSGDYEDLRAGVCQITALVGIEEIHA